MTNNALERRKKEERYFYPQTVRGREACCLFLIYQVCKLSKSKDKRTKLGFRALNQNVCTAVSNTELRPELWAQFLWGCISKATAMDNCHFPRTLNTSVLQKKTGNVLISPIVIEHFWGSQQPESGYQLI